MNATRCIDATDVEVRRMLRKGGWRLPCDEVQGMVEATLEMQGTELEDEMCFAGEATSTNLL